MNFEINMHVIEINTEINFDHSGAFLYPLFHLQ